MSEGNNSARLPKSEILGMDLDGKVKMLERIADQMLELQVELSHVAGRNAELRANLEVLKQVKSALQSAIRAEMS